MNGQYFEDFRVGWWQCQKWFLGLPDGHLFQLPLGMKSLINLLSFCYLGVSIAVFNHFSSTTGCCSLCILFQLFIYKLY